MVIQKTNKREVIKKQKCCLYKISSFTTVLNFLKYVLLLLFLEEQTGALCIYPQVTLKLDIYNE